MKNLTIIIGVLVLSVGGVDAAPPAWHFDYSNGVPTKLVWQTEIGPSYYLYASENLKDWTYVPSFPQPGTGGLMEQPFTAGERGFFKIIPAAPAPAGMVLIPAGPFEMGDALGEGAPQESPVHTVYVSQFFMAKHEVTVTLWEEVRLWAGQQTWQNFDYNILKNSNASGDGPNHPVRGSGGGSCVFSLVLQWCNARSEKEGLTPCYRLNGSIYRKDQDVTSGSNNVVWDWFDAGYYAISPAFDPRGPATGSTRILRGGSWLDSAVTCRLPRRDSLPGSSASGDLGFRVVRSK